MSRTGFALAAAFTLASAVAAQTVAPSGLPAGPGHDLTVRVCSGCHSPEVAAQQRLSRDGWSELVETMATRGAVATDDELKQVVDYLSTNFPDKPGAAPANGH